MILIKMVGSHGLSPRLLQLLEDLQEPVLLECWSAHAFLCPRCMIDAGKIPHEERNGKPCRRCGRHFWARVSGDGILITSGDNYKMR